MTAWAPKTDESQYKMNGPSHLIFCGVFYRTFQAENSILHSLQLLN